MLVIRHKRFLRPQFTRHFRPLTNECNAPSRQAPRTGTSGGLDRIE